LLAGKNRPPRPDRIHWLICSPGGERGLSALEVTELTKIDPWFIQQMQEIVAVTGESRPSRWERS